MPLYSPLNFTVVSQANWTAVVLGWEHVDPASVKGLFRGYLVSTHVPDSPLIYYISQFQNQNFCCKA